MKKNLFTGWQDIDLSVKGIEQARKTGVLLKKKGLFFDCAYTSVLKRAIRTLWPPTGRNGYDVDSCYKNLGNSMNGIMGLYRE